MANEQTITKAEAKQLIDNAINGRMFTLVFDRVAPKCEKCKKSDKRWNDLDNCPVCGAPLSKVRFTRAQKGVSEPSTALKPGTGKYAGMSAPDAEKIGVLKFFDMDAKNKAGFRGDYRSARFDSIRRLTMNGKEYVIR